MKKKLLYGFIGFLAGILTCVLAVYLFVKVYIPRQAAESLETIETIQPIAEKVDFDVKVLPVYDTLNAVNINNALKKVTVVIFSEHWCVPCQAEMPSIDSLTKKLDSSKIQFMFLSEIRGEKTINMAKKYSKEFYYYSEPLPNSLKHEMIPFAVVFDTKGQIVLKLEGSHNWNSEKMLNFLNGLAVKG